jgi:hypothetical protein
MAEQKLSKLVKMAQREEGPDAIGQAPYLRRLGYLKIAQNDKQLRKPFFDAFYRLRKGIWAPPLRISFRRCTASCSCLERGEISIPL